MRGLIVRLIAFTLVCFSFTAYLAFTIGNVHGAALGPVQLFGHRQYGLSAVFDDATGLLPDDNVKVAGVAVGKVTGITLDHGHALVSFRVRTGLRLPADTTAAIRWRNLVGQRYVYLYPGSASTVLRPGARIARESTRSVVDLGELFNRLGPVVKAIDPAKVNDFLRAFTLALEGNENTLGQALHDLSLVAETLGQRDETIGRLVTNLDTVAGAITDRDRQIRTVIDNLASVATTFNAHTDVLVAASRDLNDFTNSLASLIVANRPGLDQTVTNLDSLVGVIANRLPEIERAVTNLDDTGLSLYNASRFGEWLNQVIPCGAASLTATPATGTVPLEATCANGTHPLPAGGAGAGAPALRGTAAVTELLAEALVGHGAGGGAPGTGGAR